jgi:hypothetical protein
LLDKVFPPLWIAPFVDGIYALRKKHCENRVKVVDVINENAYHKHNVIK